MKLKSITVEGFKNIDNVTIGFDKRIIAVVAPNGYGKSNLLEAIQFAINFLKATSEEKHAMMQRGDCIPIHKDFPSKNLRIELQMDYQEDGTSSNVVYGFEFAWGDNHSEGQIIKEWLEVREDVKARKYTKMINRDGKALYRSSPTARCSMPITIKSDELIVNKLLRDESLFYLDIVKAVNRITVLACKPDMSEVEDIPALLYYLKKNHERMYSIIQNSMTIFEDIEGIDVQKVDLAQTHGADGAGLPYFKENSICSLYIKKRSLNQPIDYRCISSGEMKMLLLHVKMAKAYLSGATLITVDEPENSIHPAIEGYYIDTLRQLSGEARILIATQSVITLQNIVPEAIYVAVPDERAAADFKKIDNRKANQLRRGADSYEESTGLYIFDLLSGSDDEVEKMKGYLEK